MFALKKQIDEIDRLQKRSDFLRVQKENRKWIAKGLVLQIGDSPDGEFRFGLTATRRLSKSAVKRNRIKRRLKAAAYDILPIYAKKNMDYILVGRPETLSRSYSDIQKDLKWCLGKLNCLKTDHT